MKFPGLCFLWRECFRLILCKVQNMSDTNSYSGEDLSDEEDDEEELDPRVNDELERLNVAANSINHLEAELHEAREVFRQTMAGATYHLKLHAQKLGKSIEKAYPFYESLREMRRAYHELQAATLQFEKANSRHIYARQRVREAEQRAFSCADKCSFDYALQEMLNQATVEVNEAESNKRESWQAHQKIYKSYQTIQQRAKELQSKLKKPIEKARPYFNQKVDFDRYLWHLKLRVDSIQKGLNEAKVIYSNCLKSVELISDDIRQKRKDKKMMALLNKFHEREAGVGAESSNEDETSLNQSQLDLDLDCDTSLSEVDGIIPGEVSKMPPLSICAPLHKLSSGEGTSRGAYNITEELRDLSFKSVPTRKLERTVSGAESAKNLDFYSAGGHNSFIREVYGSERNDYFEGEVSSKDSIEPKETEKTEERGENFSAVMNMASPFKTNHCEVVHQENGKGSIAIPKESFDSSPQTEGKQTVEPFEGDKEGKGTE